MQDMGWTLLVHRACTVSNREASPVPSLMMATSSSAVRACSVSTRSVTPRWASSSRSALGQLVSRMSGSWHFFCGQKIQFSRRSNRSSKAHPQKTSHVLPNQHTQPRTPTHLTHTDMHSNMPTHPHTARPDKHTDKVSKHANTHTLIHEPNSHAHERVTPQKYTRTCEHTSFHQPSNQ